MKKYNNVQLELGRIVEYRQGINYSRPSAIIHIETEDEVLLSRILSVLEPLDVI